MACDLRKDARATGEAVSIRKLIGAVWCREWVRGNVHECVELKLSFTMRDRVRQVPDPVGTCCEPALCV